MTGNAQNGGLKIDASKLLLTSVSRPFDRYDGSASDAASPTSDAIPEVQHLLPRLQTEVGYAFKGLGDRTDRFLDRGD
jgi:hypothetical protein